MSLPLSVRDESSLPNVLTGADELREFKALIKDIRANKWRDKQAELLHWSRLSMLSDGRITKQSTHVSLVFHKLFLRQNYFTLVSKQASWKSSYHIYILFLQNCIGFQFGFLDVILQICHLRPSSPTRTSLVYPDFGCYVSSFFHLSTFLDRCHLTTLGVSSVPRVVCRYAKVWKCT